MDEQSPPPRGRSTGDLAEPYEPPTLIVLGTVAELTQQKTVGLADGTTFLGLDQAS